MRWFSLRFGSGFSDPQARTWPSVGRFRRGPSARNEARDSARETIRVLIVRRRMGHVEEPHPSCRLPNDLERGGMRAPVFSPVKRPAARASASRPRMGLVLLVSSWSAVARYGLCLSTPVFRYTYVSAEMLASDAADSLHRESAKQY